MIDLRKYSHLIWDWNGTLLNDAWLCVDVMNGMLNERKMTLRTLEEYRELFDFPVKDYYAKLGYDFEAEPFDEVGLEFMIRYNQRQREASLHEGVHDVLTTMATHGFLQHILSAREHNELIAETRVLGVSQFFRSINGLDDHYAHGKTDIGIKLINTLNADTNKVLFIGDTCHDAEVAHELGIDCILIPNGHHNEGRLLETGYPLISSVEKLKDFLL
jgi:phosphoglycolate phosphatase